MYLLTRVSRRDIPSEPLRIYSFAAMVALEIIAVINRSLNHHYCHVFSGCIRLGDC
jgi:hypothetical protein